MSGLNQASLFNSPKIQQQELDKLYTSQVMSLTSSYRQKQGLSIYELLTQHGYQADLRGLNLRNRNLNFADFKNVNIDGVDLRGASCDFAQFEQAQDVSQATLFMDENTRYYRASFGAAKLIFPEYAVSKARENLVEPQHQVPTM